MMGKLPLPVLLTSFLPGSVTCQSASSMCSNTLCSEAVCTIIPNYYFKELDVSSQVNPIELHCAELKTGKTIIQNSCSTADGANHIDSVSTVFLSGSAFGNQKRHSREFSVPL